MARREELLRAEAEGWEAFVALADSVQPDLVDLPGLNAEGWAVRDVMWARRVLVRGRRAGHERDRGGTVGPRP
jgi:hypothetical protein